jgi:hypothetical protein
LALPALRTVRAVFPHTALQSVVSSSEVSRGLPSCVECEQPGLREECVGPALMIVATSPEARPLLLLAQERSQPSADEPVDSDEGARIGVLEVAEPTAERPVEIGDDASEAVAARALRLLPDFVFEAGQALLADKPPAGLEPVAEEVEAFPGLPAGGCQERCVRRFL